MTLRALYDLPAPAKINAFLHVVGRRDDGYHLLQSPFVLIDWADTIHVERRDDGALHRHDLAAVLPAEDLCLKAARALQRASGCTLGADLHVLKRVPWGAGLGGGSSDAATVLLALNRLWGLGWTRAQLATLALTLGADVPFFVGGRNAFVEGIGEQLTPIAWPPTWYAVLKPPPAIPTALIFGDPTLQRDRKAVILSGSLAAEQGCTEADSGQVAEWAAGWGHNDLQAVASRHCPEVTEAARWLEQRFGNSRMSGSGSAVFARAGTGDQPMATMTEDELPSGWVGRMCRSLSQHPLAGWAD